MSRIPHRFVLLTFMLVAVQGCQEGEDGNVADGNAKESIREDLFCMGAAFQEFQIQKNASPTGWDEFISFAEENAEEKNLFPESIRRVRDAGYTVTWDLGGDLDVDSTTVLAVPPGGVGLKLMADGVVTEAD